MALPQDPSTDRVSCLQRQNFGKATAPCVEKASEDGHAVYTREYSGATVELDYDSWVGKVTTKEGRVF